MSDRRVWGTRSKVQCNRGVLMAPRAEENWPLSVQHLQEDVQCYVDNFAEL